MDILPGEVILLVPDQEVADTHKPGSLALGEPGDGLLHLVVLHQVQAAHHRQHLAAVPGLLVHPVHLLQTENIKKHSKNICGLVV